ncbi:MAG: hypothetical protein GY952_09475 [Rhodobacteraceae bacterium]|nr:hypothetical protein [Paracoccaceae bacterium]
MSDYNSDKPKVDEAQAAYAKRLEAEGQREIYVRKALRAHFGLTRRETVAVCADLPQARHLELLELRSRFPKLNENRLAWRISKSLTIPKEEALVWAQTIIAEEGSGGENG